MNTDKTYKRIGIFGHFGIGNLGDEAIVAAVKATLRRRLPEADIVGFSMNPEDTRRRHGLTSFPVRRSAVRTSAPEVDNNKAANGTPSESASGVKQAVKRIPLLFPILRFLYRLPRHVGDLAAEISFLRHAASILGTVDLLIFSGSGPLFDNYGGPWAFPYTLFKWVALGRLCGVKCAFLSAGAGPINAPLSRRLLRWALNLSAYHSYRDEYSRDLIASIGVRPPNPVLPDLAWNLDISSGEHPAGDPPARTVGVNPVPFGDARYWARPDAEAYRNYVAKLAAFSLWLQDRGCRVVLFNTKIGADSWVVDDIYSDIAANTGTTPERITTRRLDALDQLVEFLGACDVVVAARFHGILLPCLLNRPVIGFAYHPKTFALMKQAGFGDFSVDIASFTVDDLKERYERLDAEYDKVTAALAPAAEAARRELEAQYDEVLKL